MRPTPAEIPKVPKLRQPGPVAPAGRRVFSLYDPQASVITYASYLPLARLWTTASAESGLAVHTAVTGPGSRIGAVTGLAARSTTTQD